MPELPSGRVTLLFTDIEGSTRLVQELGAERYGDLLSLHSQLIRTVVEAHGGHEFGSEGDAHFFAFHHAGDAVRAAVDMQRSLRAAEWPSAISLRVRIGLHTGVPEVRDGNYVGVDLSRVARITAAGHGGQTLASEVTRRAASEPAAPASFIDLGQHRLKDLIEPEHLFQIVAPGLPDEFPPIRTIDTRPKQLPAQVTSFLGREDELATVVRLLEDHRMVTLTGPGGSGKTRLAIAVADRSLPAFEDGVFFVPLAPVRDAGMLTPTVASALGVREAPDRPLLASLLEYVRTRRLLLALDNFEHLVAGAPVVTQLLEAGPGVRALVTSRTVLHLYGEREYSVPTLPLPDPAAELPRLAANPAVALFVDRATAVDPGFALTATTARPVAEICRRVDGLPLAIELAAARMRILSADELARRLQSRLGALVGGAADLPQRQQTLRGTIEWSHDLLDEPQRRMFRRLSVFEGGWTLDAVEAVVSVSLGRDTLDVLEGLVDQSLVRRPTEAEGRFEMLETIHEFAAERLTEAGERAEIQRRHADFYVTLAEAAEPHLTGEQGSAWSDRLRRDVDNLRAALRWSAERGGRERLAVGLRIAAAVWRYWQREGTLSEGRAWLDQLLLDPAGREIPAVRAKSLLAAAGIAYWQNDYDATAQRYEEAATLAEAIEDAHLIAEAREGQAYAAAIHGDMATWRSRMLQAREQWAAVGERFRAALAAGNAAYTAFLVGQGYADAIPAMNALIDEARLAGDRYWLINGLTGLGQLHRMLGNVAEARRHYAQALVLALEDNNLAMLTMTLEPLANVESDAGEHERAVRLWAASLTIKERIGGGAPAEEMRVVDPRDAAVRAIGQDRVDRASADGRTMTPAEAVSEAASIAGIESAG